MHRNNDFAEKNQLKYFGNLCKIRNLVKTEDYNSQYQRNKLFPYNTSNQIHCTSRRNTCLTPAYSP